MYAVSIVGKFIGYTKVGSVNFIQKEPIKDSIFIEQQKKYHKIVNNLNNEKHV